MTTGATGQLGLALPVQGELSGTWGDTVNNGLTQYTNIAIAGTLTLTGDGAVTLANTTGDASASNITSTLAGAGTVTAQFAMVRVSGTTVAKTVTGPSYSKSYIIDNASSFSVTFKASGQTGVSISPSEKVGVYYNGTDYVKTGGGGITYGAVKTANYTAVINDGVLTNTTGGAFTVTLPATPATGTQVFIADSAGTWGTNNLTIGRNGSTIEGSATDLVCDINSVSIQCVYNGTTWDIFAQIGANDTAVVTLNGTQTLTNKTMSGASNTFTNLSLTTAVTGTLPTANGGTNLSSFTSGGVVYASSTSALATGSALTFDGTNLGVLAGSVTTPAAKIHAVGNVRSSNGAGTVYSQLESDGVYSSGTDLYLLAPTGYSNIFYANNAEQMRLTSTGLGIGTSSPAARLGILVSGMTNQLLVGANASNSAYGSISLSGTNLDTGRIGFTGGGNTDLNLYIDVPSGGTHQFRNATTTMVTVNSVGNLKTIGTISVGNATPSTSGAGITFPATQSASSDANTLDDYEEGTWSSAVTNDANVTGTGALDRADYTKIGRLVTVVGRVTGLSITTVSSTVAVGLTLPFAMSGNLVVVMGPCRASGTNEMIGIILDATGGNATVINLLFPAAQVTANGSADFSFSLTYQASA